MSDDLLTLRYVPLSQIARWNRNAKRHDLGAIIASIERHGFKDPLKFEPMLNAGAGGIIEGNGRDLALVAMRDGGKVAPRGIGTLGDNGKTDWAVPVLFGVDAPSQSAAEAYGVDHNNITLMGGDFDLSDLARLWDDDFTGVLNDLAAADELPVSVGVDDLAKLVAADQVPQDAEPQIDRAEELNKKWQVKTGDLWRIGEHRLLCGDCTRREDVERVMQGERAELLFTSPPYSDMRTYKGGELSPEHLATFIPTWQEFVRYQVVNLGIKRNGDEVVEYWNEYIKAARDCGYKLLSWNVWDKNEAGGPSNQMAMFAIEHEFLFVFGAESKALTRIENKKHPEPQTPKLRRQPDGSLKRSTAGENYEFKNSPTIFRTHSTEHGYIRKFHPATFPVELPELYIKTMTGESVIIVDAFVGSGTTIVACQNLGRKCRAIEISPAYCAVALERMATAFPDIEIERID